MHDIQQKLEAMRAGVVRLSSGPGAWQAVGMPAGASAMRTPAQATLMLQAEAMHDLCRFEDARRGFAEVVSRGFFSVVVVFMPGLLRIADTVGNGRGSRAPGSTRADRRG